MFSQYHSYLLNNYLLSVQRVQLRMLKRAVVCRNRAGKVVFKPVFHSAPAGKKVLDV